MHVGLLRADYVCLENDVLAVTILFLPWYFHNSVIVRASVYAYKELLLLCSQTHHNIFKACKASSNQISLQLPALSHHNPICTMPKSSVFPHLLFDIPKHSHNLQCFASTVCCCMLKDSLDSIMICLGQLFGRDSSLRGVYIRASDIHDKAKVTMLL